MCILRNHHKRKSLLPLMSFDLNYFHKMDYFLSSFADLLFVPLSKHKLNKKNKI